MTELSTPKKPKLSSKELEQRNQCLKKLQESGDFDRLKNDLYAQLMLQESWRDEMKERTREALQTSGGIAEITLDELVQNLVQNGKGSVPSAVEMDLKAKIRRSCFDK